MYDPVTNPTKRNVLVLTRSDIYVVISAQNHRFYSTTHRKNNEKKKNSIKNNILYAVSILTSFSLRISDNFVWYAKEKEKIYNYTSRMTYYGGI